MTRIEQDGHRFLFVMLNGVKHLPHALKDSSSLRSSDYTLMNFSKAVLSEANDKRMLAKPFKICVNLSHLCYLCAF